MTINRNSISVIIPMYNSADTIIGTLDSINSQTFDDYLKEIIVVNDGSIDNSPVMVQQYSAHSKIRINLINKPNGGVSSARNTGIKCAKGEWIAFCDSDDNWFKDKIENQVYIINKSIKNIDFIGGNHLAKLQYILFKPIKYLHKLTVKEVCIKSLPQTSTILMRRNIVEKIGLFDVTQNYAEDGNFFLKAIANFDCYYSPIQMVLYGNGKRGFGESGLSANTKAMHLGELKNLKEMLNYNYIDKKYYKLAKIFLFIKYIRRLFIIFISHRK